MKTILKHKLLSLVFTILLIAEIILNMYASFNFGQIINERNSDAIKLFLISIYVFLTFASALIFTFVLKIFTDFYFMKILNYHRSFFAKGISTFSYLKFTKETEGSYIGDFVDNIKIVLQKNVISKFNILQGFAMLITGLIFISFINPYLALWSFLLSLIMFAFPLLINKKYSKSNQNLVSINNQYTSTLSTVFKSFKTLLLFNNNKEIESKLIEISKKQTKTEFQNKLITNSFGLVNGILSILVQVLIVSLAIYYYKRGEAKLGGVISLSILFQSLLGGMSKFIFSISESTSSKKINKELIDKYAIHFQKKDLNLFFEKVIVKNYQFKIGNKNILEIPNFQISKNEKIAIIAKSGSGKTTFVESIINIKNDYNGNILFDNLDFRNKYKNNIVGSIKYVEQNSYIFNDTILYNITLNDVVDFDRFNYLVELLDLRELLDSKVERENFVITENGVNLSGGQRQKISLARALYFNPSFLILDEATSQIDSKTAKLIEERILRLNKTIIMISHHLDVNNYNFNSIYTIENNILKKI